MTDEEKKKLYIYVLIAALLGGGGSTGMQMLTSNTRSDPFTGQEGKAMREYFDVRCNATREAVKANERAIHDIHGDIRSINQSISKLPPAPLLERITRQEERTRQLEKNLRRVFENYSPRKGLKHMIEQMDNK